MFRLLISWVLGLVGAAAGGAAGYLAFIWIAKQGLYMMVLPGTMLGFGCALLARHYSVLRGLLCFAAAIALAFSEWMLAPFKKDDSLQYFLQHVHQLTPITLIFILLGALVAYWTGRTHYFGTDRPRKEAF